MRSKKEIEQQIARLKRQIFDLELTGYARTKKQDLELEQFSAAYEFGKWVLDIKPDGARYAF